jgi:molybdopterin adenylyltransferase
MDLKIGIITISDRASQGIYEDISGKCIMEVLDLYILNNTKYDYKVIADEQLLIENTIKQMAKDNCSLIVTTGGTGPSKRDVTPEAMENVCKKMLPGFGEMMRSVSLQYVPTAILSRQSAGIIDNSLVVNLPGKPKSIKECLDAVFPAIPYCIDLIEGAFIEVNEDNIKAFRPKS